MRNVRLLVAYDGTAYFGWQRQDGFDSIQERIEEAVCGVCGQVVTVHGSGRTDTGVHALGQVASFHVDTKLTDDRLRHALNAYLPADVRVRRLETCADEFHPRFDAVSKRYIYMTVTSRVFSPFYRGRAHWVRTKLDRGAMRRAARALEGRHDFAAFGNSGSVRKTTVRTLKRLRIVARRERFALIAEGDGFLYNMVRTLAGTLLAVGTGKLSPSEVQAALESRDRSRAGPTAPACGLYLVRVRYPVPTFGAPDRGPHGAPGLF